MPALRLLAFALLAILLVPDALAQRPTLRPRAVPSPKASTRAQTTQPAAITGYARGSVRTLPISGTRGTNMETLMAPGSGWVYGIEIGENQDQPCYVGLWAVEGTAPAPGFPVAFNRCVDEPTPRSIAALGFEKGRNQEDWRRARQVATGLAIGIPIYTEIRVTSALIAAAFDNSDPSPPLPVVNGEPMSIDGVGVCQNTSNDEVKGLRIHGSTLDMSGSSIETDPIVTTAPQSVGGYTIPAGTRRNISFERPNCSNNDGWKTVETCRADEVLVGLDLHYKFPGWGGNQNRVRITGIAAKCARVTVNRS